MKDVCATLLLGSNEFSSLKIKMKLRYIMSELHPVNNVKSVDGKWCLK